MNAKELTKEFLYKEYVELGKSMAQIARENSLNSHTVISYYLKKFGKDLKIYGIGTSLLTSNPEHLIKAAKKRRKGYGEISGIQFGKIIARARHSNLEFNLTIEFLWELFLKQDRKCALTGVPIKFPKQGERSKGTASLDRIDSSKGYFPENVRWTHKTINLMKLKHSDKVFDFWCQTRARYIRGNQSIFSSWWSS